MKFNRRSGMVRGRIKQPSTQQSNVFHGAVLDKQGVGGGLLLGRTETGYIFVEPVAP